MPFPPRITDESVLTRWMGIEVAKMNEGLVTQRKPLFSLLAEKEPVAVTRKGGTPSPSTMMGFWKATLK